MNSYFFIQSTAIYNYQRSIYLFLQVDIFLYINPFLYRYFFFLFFQSFNLQYQSISLLPVQLQTHSLLMIPEKDKQTDQLLKFIAESNKAIDDWASLYGEKLTSTLFNHQDEEALNFSKLALQDQTSCEIHQQKPKFFTQIPLTNIDQQTQQRIQNFRLNFVSARRKDDLFKRYRRQQQQKLTSRKRMMQQSYTCKLDNLKNIKGQFTLKKGDQTHTCSITSDDLDKLRPQTDLNDTIIANYLKYLQTQVFSQQLDKTIYVYSSFFIQKLIGDMLREDIIMFERDPKLFAQRLKYKVSQNYNNIKRWTRKVDIFEKQYLIIPINAFKHWYCVIVVNPGCILQPKPDKKAYIANCDSMFEKKYFIIDAIRMYLQVQLQDKKSKTIQITEQNCPCYQLLLPRQTNTHDCGLYMLTYIQHLLLDTKHLQNLDDVKKRQKLDLFPRNLIYSMRQRLKQLFVKLIQTPDENLRKKILTDYKLETQKLINAADESDYDKINPKQLKKYEIMNSYLLENMSYNGMPLPQQQFEYACKIKFYLDPQINFYERDKPMFM